MSAKILLIQCLAAFNRLLKTRVTTLNTSATAVNFTILEVHDVCFPFFTFNKGKKFKKCKNVSFLRFFQC